MITLTLLPLLQAAPLIFDLQDGTSLSEAEAVLNLDLEWVHPKTSDEGLAYLETNDTLANNALLQLHQESLPPAD